MANRNLDRKIATNLSETYRQLRKSRGREYSLEQYRSPTINYPTSEEFQDLEYIRHTWKTGDRYFKLAHEYYGDSTYWWVIALFNKKPTENHVKMGSTVYIPQPLDRVLLYCSVQ
jgi:nucleoid-associated protein YgaU